MWEQAGTGRDGGRRDGGGGSQSEESARCDAAHGARQEQRRQDRAARELAVDADWARVVAEVSAEMIAIFFLRK